jgi:hypothetical protein
MESVGREFYATSRRQRGYGVIAEGRRFSALLKMLHAGWHEYVNRVPAGLIEGQAAAGRRYRCS